MLQRLARLRTVLLCASFLIPYLALTLPRLGLPGFSAEEAMTLLPLYGYHTHPLVLGGLRLPLDFGVRHGAMESYLAWPFLLALGNIPEAVRLCVISFGAATLLCVFFFCREFFRDDRVAWGAALLLALWPAFVSGTRMGTDHGSVLLFFQCGAWLAVLRWVRSGRLRWLCLGAFLLGMGMACRSWFVFSLAGSLLAVGLLWLPGRTRAVLAASGRWRAAAAGAGCFLLGAWPLAVFLLRHAGEFLALVSRSLLHDAAGSYALTYLELLSGRGRQLSGLWQGDPFTLQAFALSLQGWAPAPTLWPVLLAPLWLGLSCMLPASVFAVRKKLFLPVFSAFFLALSPFVPDAFNPDHLLPAIPAGAMMLALAAADLSDVTVGRLSAPARVIVPAGLILLRCLAHPPQLQVRLRSMAGASPYHTDAVEAAADWLSAQAQEAVVMDYGIDNTFAFLTRGRRLGAISHIGHGNEHYARPLLASLYVAYAPDIAGFCAPRGSLRLDTARLQGRCRIVRRFRNRDGTPRIVVYRIDRSVGDLRPYLIRRDHEGRLSSAWGASAPKGLAAQ